MLFRHARTVGLVAALLVPFGLLHAFVLAEIGIGIVDVLFLAQMVRDKNFLWAREPWFIVSMLWWVWLLLCSVPAPNLGFGTAGWSLSFVQALVVIRLILFAAALQNWLLTTPRARHAAWLMVALSCLWIGLESWQQYLTGTNIFGNHRWGDGALTGPFWKPRAGAPYGHMLYTAMLPAALALFAKPGKAARIGGIVLIVLGVITSILIGQRMATALTGLGLVTAALFFPQLRRVAAAAFVAAVLVLLATPIISPPTHNKLVKETSRNLHHFALSPYGELYTRATVMGLQSPWHGWGFNGFRVLCPEPRFGGGLPALGIGPTDLKLGACNLHPHNFYIQAFNDAGIPGLLLFCAMNLVWLATLLPGLWRNPEPLRVGLFISILTFAWPIASADNFTAFYMAGWLFMLLGLGLALAHVTPDPTAPELHHG